MHRSSNIIREKIKVPVELKKDDGTKFEGFVFVGGQERVMDLFNNKEPFLPFEHKDGRFGLINKRTIADVWPDDASRMGDTYTSPPSDAVAFRRVRQF